MTPEEQAQVAQLMNLGINVQVIQVGQEIRLMIQIATNMGVMNQYVLTQDAARALSKAIKEGVQIAETTIVRPPSLIATA